MIKIIFVAALQQTYYWLLAAGDKTSHFQCAETCDRLAL
jgi:hypothetical protein